jgi:hypothetical protein
MTKKLLAEPIHAWRTDASEHRRPGVIGIGLVLYFSKRNGAPGRELKRFCEAYHDISPGKGEILAVYRAIELSVELGISRMQIWCDFRLLASRLRIGLQQVETCESGPIDHIVLDAARRLGQVEFRYLPRRRNVIANQLARHAASVLKPERPDVVAGGAFERTGPPAHHHHAYPEYLLRPEMESAQPPPATECDRDEDDIPF